ncbi:MAG: NifB/NifX family molybdenum-iron cluster-binding protein [Candidatus Nezhaarchaeales archaeon]
MVFLGFQGWGGPPPWIGGGRGGGWGRGWGPGFAQPVEAPQIPPPQPNVMRVVLATLDDRGLESMISPRFARAPYITIVDVAQGAVSQVRSIPNPFASLPHGAGVSIAQWIISIGARAVIGVVFGPNIGVVLQQAGVAVHTVPPNYRVVDALKSLGIIR